MRFRPLPLLLALLALILLGTLIVLTSVQHYYAIDLRDLVTAGEMRSWEEWAAETDRVDGRLSSTSSSSDAVPAIFPGQETKETQTHTETETDERVLLQQDPADEDDDALDGGLPVGNGGLSVGNGGEDAQITLAPGLASSQSSDPYPSSSTSKLPSIYLPAASTTDPLPSIYLPSPSATDPLPSIFLPSPTLYRPPEERLVPKLIHQTWKDEDVPERWEEVRQGCIEMHPDYQYHLWTDAASRSFLATHYPWFLETFDGYQFSIQRADVIRYFILHHFGGFYLDLDVGCRRRLEALRYAPLLLPQTIPVGISNDIMSSIPRHPFWEMAMRNLKGWDVDLLIKYATVMFSTGPMFLSFQYNLWPYTHGVPISIDPATSLNLNLSFPTVAPSVDDDDSFWGDEERKAVRVLPRIWYGKNKYVVDNETDPITGGIVNVNPAYFRHYFGSSWHSNDAGFVTFLGRSGLLLPYLGLGILVVGLLRMGFSHSRTRHRSGHSHTRSRSEPRRRNSRELPSYRSGYVSEQVFSSLWRRGEIRLSEDGNQSGGILVWNSSSPSPEAQASGWWSWVPQFGRGSVTDRTERRGDTTGYTPLPNYSRPASPDGTGTEVTSDTELDGEASEAESEWESPSGPDGESSGGGILSRLRLGAAGMKLKKMAGTKKRRPRGNTIRVEEGGISPIGRRQPPSTAITSGEEDEDEDGLPTTTKRTTTGYGFFARRKDGRVHGHRARASSGSGRFPDPPSRPQSVSGSHWFASRAPRTGLSPPPPPLPAGPQTEWAADAQAEWSSPYPSPGPVGAPPKYEPGPPASSSSHAAAAAPDAKVPLHTPPGSPSLLSFSPDAQHITFASGSGTSNVRAQVDRFLKEMEPDVGDHADGR